jgi:Fur family ferric uptake transcriptional regulator
LKAKNIKPDRSTVYRELQSLTKNNIIIKSTILDVDYYEIPQDHHHHLVCLNCQQISSVKMDNHLEEQEKILAKQNKFSIVSHSLEFYGYCHECQNIIN